MNTRPQTHGGPKREAPTRPVASLAPIPDDVMELAEEAYLHAIYMTTSDEPRNMVTEIARAIMAERERCAQIARDYIPDQPGPEGADIADAILLPTIHSRTT